MSNKTTSGVIVNEAVINVREYGGTYIARASGLGIIASCTCGAEAAARRCADKVFGEVRWIEKRVTAHTYVYSTGEAANG